MKPSPRSQGLETHRVLLCYHQCVTKTNMSKTLTLRLEDDVAEALEGEARRTNRSKGRIVRDALKDHLRRERPSALEALKKYAGIIEGPEDLSTNKKYLAGFGKARRV